MEHADVAPGEGAADKLLAVVGEGRVADPEAVRIGVERGRAKPSSISSMSSASMIRL